jgi:hypothetical protein
MHRTLVLGQVLYLPLLGIPPAIIKVKNLGRGVFIEGEVDHIYVMPSGH